MFVDEWCQSLSDPVYAREVFKNKNEKLEACAIGVEENNSVNKIEDGNKDENENQNIEKKCPLCKLIYDLDECSKFLEKNSQGQKGFPF